MTAVVRSPVDASALFLGELEQTFVKIPRRAKTAVAVDVIINNVARLDM